MGTPLSYRLQQLLQRSFSDHWVGVCGNCFGAFECSGEAISETLGRLLTLPHIVCDASAFLPHFGFFRACLQRMDWYEIAGDKAVARIDCRHLVFCNLCEERGKKPKLKVIRYSH